jgi:hypothetical protein
MKYPEQRKYCSSNNRKAARSWITGSNSTRGVDVCPNLLSCIGLCRQRTFDEPIRRSGSPNAGVRDWMKTALRAGIIKL